MTLICGRVGSSLLWPNCNRPLLSPRITRDGGGITADHVLRQGVHLNAALIQVLFDPVPIPRLAQVFQEIAQPVVTKIQRFYGLRGEPTQGVFHALDVGFNRHLP